MHGVLLAVGVFSTSFVAHLAVSHLTQIARPERRLVGFMVAAILAYPVAYLIVPTSPLTGSPLLSPLADVTAGLATVGFLTLGYIQFWSLIERSFTLRILIDTASVEGGLTRAEIAKAYSGGRGLAWMMDRRVEDLVGAGLLAREGSTYRLTRRARVVAWLARRLEAVVGVR